MAIFPLKAEPSSEVEDTCSDLFWRIALRPIISLRTHLSESMSWEYMELYAVTIEQGSVILHDGRTGRRIGSMGPPAVAAQVVGESIYITTQSGAVEEWSGRVRCFVRLVSRPTYDQNDYSDGATDRADTIGAYVVWGIFGIFFGVLFVVPLPGTLLNWWLGRFADDKNGLFIASRGDGWTWLVSLLFWLTLTLLVIRFRRWWTTRSTQETQGATLSPAERAKRRNKARSNEDDAKRQTTRRTYAEMNRTERVKVWIGVPILALVTGVACTAGLLILFGPGLIYDWRFDRFDGYPDDFWHNAFWDGRTWLISLLFWTGIGSLVALYRRSKFHTSTGDEDLHDTDGDIHDDAFGRGPSQSDQPESHDQAAAPPFEDDDLASLCTESACAKALGLSGRCTMEDVRNAYRRKIAEYHPDKVAHLGPKLRELAEMESKRLNIAYQYFVEHHGQAA